MPETKTFDPAAIIATIGAWPVTGGWSPGTFVKASRNTDTFSSEAGATGEVVRSRKHDKRGTIEFTFLRSAAINDYLSGLQAADEEFGTGIVPISITDLNGTTKVFGSESWLKKPTDLEENVEAPHRTYIFEVASLDIFVGGNTV
jgi:hypothetical protein